MSIELRLDRSSPVYSRGYNWTSSWIEGSNSGMVILCSSGLNKYFSVPRQVTTVWLVFTSMKPKHEEYIRYSKRTTGTLLRPTDIPSEEIDRLPLIPYEMRHWFYINRDSIPNKGYVYLEY